jgi:hypothetical protein
MMKTSDQKKENHWNKLPQTPSKMQFQEFWRPQNYRNKKQHIRNPNEMKEEKKHTLSTHENAIAMLARATTVWEEQNHTFRFG